MVWIIKNERGTYSKVGGQELLVKGFYDGMKQQPTANLNSSLNLKGYI